MSRTCAIPIGMSMEVTSSLSLPEVEVYRFWDFGAGQCASSDGFWATIIPGKRSGEVIFTYSLTLKSMLLHDWIDDMRGRSRSGRMSSKELSSTPRFRQERHRPIVEATRTLKEEMRFNVMTPAPDSLGVLVATEPTDDGRIGTDRNTERRNHDYD